MKIKTTVRGGLSSASAVVSPALIANPRRGCPTVITVRPVLTTAILLA